MLLPRSFFPVLRGAQAWLSPSPPASCLVRRGLHSTSHDAMAEKSSAGLAAYLGAVDSKYRRGAPIPKGLVCELVKEGLKTRRSISVCKEIQGRASRSGLSSDPAVGSLLIRLFAANGSLREANSIFGRIGEADEVAWSTIIFANAKLGDPARAMDLYLRMQGSGAQPGASAFAAILKACCGAKSLGRGREIHQQIVESAREAVPGVVNMLVAMYCKCGCLADAGAARRTAEAAADVVTWSSLIGGHARGGSGDEAAGLFGRMQQEGVCPNGITFASILQACSRARNVALGRAIHARVSVRPARDVYVDSALVDMYMKCGRAESAARAFEAAAERNLITWSAMISGCLRLGRAEDALLLYRRMRREGTEPNDLMRNSLLAACSATQASDGSRAGLDELWRAAMRPDAAGGNALIGLYAKQGSLAFAHLVFELLPRKDREAWNALIVAYAQHDRGAEAMKLFRRMPYAAVDMDTAFYPAVVRACSAIGALGTGMLIHGIVAEMELEVGSCLVDMYAKCGRLDDASRTFRSLRNRDVVAWGAIIAAHAQCRGFASALRCFREMRAEGFAPNGVIFVSLLSACSHSSFGAQGHSLFRSMEERYGIVPTVEHYNCLVDLLARAGRLEEARDMLTSLPYRPNVIGFTSLLEHSKSYGNLELFNDCIDRTRRC